MWKQTAHGEGHPKTGMNRLYNRRLTSKKQWYDERIKVELSAQARVLTTHCACMVKFCSVTQLLGQGYSVIVCKDPDTLSYGVQGQDEKVLVWYFVVAILLRVADVTLYNRSLPTMRIIAPHMHCSSLLPAAPELTSHYQWSPCCGILFWWLMPLTGVNACLQWVLAYQAGHCTPQASIPLRILHPPDSLVTY